MIIIISFLLDGIMSNLFNINGYFISVFSLMSLVLVYKKGNDNYYGYAILLGLLFDISYSDTLFLNAFIFLIISYVITKFYNIFDVSLITSIIVGIIAIVIYRMLTYFILCIIGYLDFNIYKLFISIITSIPLNLLYIGLIYLFRYLKGYMKKIVIN